MSYCPCNECNNTDNKEKGVTFDVALELMKLGKIVRMASNSDREYRLVKVDASLEMILSRYASSPWREVCFSSEEILADDWEEV